MSEIYVKDSTAAPVVCLLSQAAGTPVTGLSYTDVRIDVKKGNGAFAYKSLSALDFVEVGSGYYIINLGTTDTSTLGSLVVRVTGTSVATALIVGTVLAATPVVPTGSVTTPVSYLFGYVLAADGTPIQDSNVVARPLPTSNVSSVASPKSAIAQGPIVAQTDSEGFFILQLIPSTSVDIVISDANYRRAVVVPSSPANLFTLP